MVAVTQKDLDIFKDIDDVNDYNNFIQNTLPSAINISLICDSLFNLTYKHYMTQFPHLKKITIITYYLLRTKGIYPPIYLIDQQLAPYAIQFYTPNDYEDFIALTNFIINIYDDVAKKPFNVKDQTSSESHEITENMLIEKLNKSIHKILKININDPTVGTQFVQIGNTQIEVSNNMTIPTQHANIQDFTRECRALIFTQFEHNERIIYYYLDDNKCIAETADKTNHKYIYSKKMIQLDTDMINECKINYWQIHHEWRTPPPKQIQTNTPNVVLSLNDIKDIFERLPDINAYKELAQKFDIDPNAFITNAKQKWISVRGIYHLLEKILPLFKYFINHCNINGFMNQLTMMDITCPHMSVPDAKYNTYDSNKLCFITPDIASIYFYLQLKIRVIFPAMFETSDIQYNIAVSDYEKILPLYCENNIIETNISSFKYTGCER